MVAGPFHESRLWKELEGVVAFSDPARPVDRYLGAHPQELPGRERTGVHQVRSRREGVLPVCARSVPGGHQQAALRCRRQIFHTHHQGHRWRR
eukprot:4121048-Heterocapsa_arctica.AAC.1